MVVLIFLIYIIILVGYSLIRGAPYAPLSQSRIQVIIDLLKLKPGQKMADLGSGDGRIVMAFARKGVEAHGFEINPLLVFISRWRIKQAGLEKKAFVHQKSYWNEDLSGFDVVTLYGITHIMGGIEKKLKKELKSGSQVVSNHFKFPNWKATNVKSDVYLYKYTHHIARSNL